jgi:hypothetical protein
LYVCLSTVYATQLRMAGQDGTVVSRGFAV